MSLITRCPACSTLFKVVPDQLRVAQGWVRCGECGEMFVATAQLLSPEEAERAQAPAGTAGPSADPSVAALMADLPDLDIGLPSLEPTAASEATAHQAAAADQAPGARLLPPAATVEPAAPAEDLALPVDTGLPLDVATTTPWPSEAIEVVGPGQADAALVDVSVSGGGLAAAEAGAPFLATDRAGAASAARPRRRRLAWVAAVLALALAMQIAIDRRDVLAAHWPALTPALQALCQPFACRVAPLRQLDAVVIEASSFQRLQADRFRLGASLRNRADWPVALPAIELTLTDAQDQPLARRVLPAQELGGAQALPPRAEFDFTRDLVVSAPVDAAAVAGYKLLLFHP